MNIKDKNIEKILIISSILILILITLIFLFRASYKLDDEDKKRDISRKDLDLLITNIKNDNQNLELEYENTADKDFKSLVYEENGRYKSVIIDTNSGVEITFKDLIKEESISEFEAKEKELLTLKYPEFIVKGLTENPTGYKFYYVKDNEVIIFYYDYTFIYPYTEQISLCLNYNEIKDYLSFKPTLDSKYENENGYNYNPNKKVIALSFDDGPSKPYNSKILDELAKNKAHATFFMVGSMMNSCQKCVLDTYKSGNEVASHTYEHMNIKTNSLEKVNESLIKVDNVYYEITGDHIKYLRPPYGAYNKKNLENATVPFILWDMDTEDWRYRNVEHIVNYIMNNARDGSIILMHELYETSYEALKIALPRLYAEGYQVVNITELANLKGKTLEVGKAYTALH